jgi:hypothetical protein
MMDTTNNSDTSSKAKKTRPSALTMAAVVGTGAVALVVCATADLWSTQQRSNNHHSVIRSLRRALSSTSFADQSAVAPSIISTSSTQSSRSLLGLSAASLPPGLEFNAVDVMHVPLSSSLDGDNTHKETPVFWKHIKTGSGISAVPFLSDCLNLVTASEVGGGLSYSYRGALSVVSLPNERRYVNFDASTKEGLSSSKAHRLPSSGLADLVITSHLKEVVGLFDTKYRARLFTILQHPVTRSVSTFFSLKVSFCVVCWSVCSAPFWREKKLRDWDNIPTPPLLTLFSNVPLFSLLQRRGGKIDAPSHLRIFADMSLQEYALSNHVESNYLVRSLVNKPTGALLATDLYLSKIILRQKFLVGLSDEMSQSLDRIKMYFPQFQDVQDHYRLGVRQSVHRCKAQYLSEAHVSQARTVHSHITPEHNVWKQLSGKNWADVALYEYAKDVFRQQGAALFSELVQNYKIAAEKQAAEVEEHNRLSAAAVPAQPVVAQEAQPVQLPKPAELAQATFYSAPRQAAATSSASHNSPGMDFRATQLKNLAAAITTPPPAGMPHANKGI